MPERMKKSAINMGLLLSSICSDAFTASSKLSASSMVHFVRVMYSSTISSLALCLSIVASRFKNIGFC